MVWDAPRAAACLASAGRALATAALTINGTDRDLAITPDGSRIVYVGTNGTQLFVRALDALEPVAVFKGALGDRSSRPTASGSVSSTHDTLKKVAITGGPAVTLARVDSAPRGATWAPDGDNHLRDQPYRDRSTTRLSRRRHA